MPTNKHNPFRKRRGEPAWASSPVLKQNRKRARLVAKGISGRQTKAEMRRLGEIAIAKPTTG